MSEQQQQIHDCRRQWLAVANDARDFIALVHAQEPPMQRRNLLVRWWVTRHARAMLRESQHYLASLDRLEAAL